MGSTVFSNICDSWLRASRHLRRSQPSNILEWRSFPLWIPHIHHIQPKKVNCLSVGNITLRDSGLLIMADITNADGDIIAWEQLPAGGLPPSTERAYRSLISNIAADPTFCEDRWDPIPAFFEDPASARVWEYNIPRNKVEEVSNSLLSSLLPACTFNLLNDTLSSTDITVPPSQARLKRIQVGRRRASGTKQQKSVKVADYAGALHIATLYDWRDGKSLLTQIHAIFASSKQRLHQELTIRYKDGGDTTGENLIGVRFSVIHGCLIELLKEIAFFGRYSTKSQPPNVGDTQLSLVLIEKHTVLGAPGAFGRTSSTVCGTVLKV